MSFAKKTRRLLITVTNCGMFLILLGVSNVIWVCDAIALQPSPAEIESLVRDVANSIGKKEFDLLKKYKRPEEVVYVRGCNDLDGYGQMELAFYQLIRELIAISVGATPHATVWYPNLDKSRWKRTDIQSERVDVAFVDKITIATEGWVGETPFIDFTFINQGGRWRLESFCSSGTHDPEIPYLEIPLLPRPGPRTFSAKDFLFERLQEIIQFRSFDALRAYATQGVVKELSCNQGMFDRSLSGVDVPVRHVIKSLKDRSVAGRDIVFTRLGELPMILESSGWNGADPIVNFVVRPTGPDSKYEWVGVAYCHSRVSLRPAGVQPPFRPGFEK